MKWKPYWNRRTTLPMSWMNHIQKIESDLLYTDRYHIYNMEGSFVTMRLLCDDEIRRNEVECDVAG